MKKRTLISGVILLALTLLLLLGSATFLGACAPTAEGSYMTCHWAGRAVTGAAAVLVVLAAARLLLRDAGMQSGLAIAVIPSAVLAAAIPGNLIRICGMASMHCRTHLKPGAIVLGVLIAIAAGADAFAVRRAREGR